VAPPPVPKEGAQTPAPGTPAALAAAAAAGLTSESTAAGEEQAGDGQQGEPEASKPEQSQQQQEEQQEGEAPSGDASSDSDSDSSSPSGHKISMADFLQQGLPAPHTFCKYLQVALLDEETVYDLVGACLSVMGGCTLLVALAAHG